MSRTAKKSLVFLALFVSGAVFLNTVPMSAAERLSLDKHIQVQVAITPDARFNSLPSVGIDRIDTVVSLDDMIDADESFHRPFVEELTETIPWYLRQRGLRVAGADADLKLRGRILEYVGDGGWGDWGVRMSMELTVFRGYLPVANKTLTVRFNRPSRVAVQKEFCAPYLEKKLACPPAQQLVLTRVAVDLVEAVLDFLLTLEAQTKAVTDPAVRE